MWKAARPQPVSEASGSGSLYRLVPSGPGLLGDVHCGLALAQRLVATEQVRWGVWGWGTLQCWAYLEGWPVAWCFQRRHWRPHGVNQTEKLCHPGKRRDAWSVSCSQADLLHRHQAKRQGATIQDGEVGHTDRQTLEPDCTRTGRRLFIKL